LLIKEAQADALNFREVYRLKLVAWRRSLYTPWPLAYHFTKWYASSLNRRTSFCVVFSLCSLHYFTQQTVYI